MPKTFLLTDEFPPVQTGIARLMGEIARRYPKGELLVSTGQHRDASETDGAYATAMLDRLPLSLRELGLDPLAEHVKVVPLGTDPAQFMPGLDTREVRARYRLNGDSWAVTVARLEPYKGVDTSLRAVAAVRKGGQDLHYLVIGAGKKGKEYKKLARELGIGDVVRFTGNVPDRDLPALYNTAQVYLGVSRRADATRVEGFGVALAEARPWGLPG